MSTSVLRFCILSVFFACSFAHATRGMFSTSRTYYAPAPAPAPTPAPRTKSSQSPTYKPCNGQHIVATNTPMPYKAPPVGQNPQTSSTHGNQGNAPAPAWGPAPAKAAPKPQWAPAHAPAQHWAPAPVAAPAQKWAPAPGPAQQWVPASPSVSPSASPTPSPRPALPGSSIQLENVNASATGNNSLSVGAEKDRAAAAGNAQDGNSIILGAAPGQALGVIGQIAGLPSPSI